MKNYIRTDILSNLLFDVASIHIRIAYSYRDDARRGGERSREGWEFKARDADDTDDNIRPWVCYTGSTKDFSTFRLFSWNSV